MWGFSMHRLSLSSDGRICTADTPGAAQNEEGHSSQPPPPLQAGCSQKQGQRKMWSPQKKPQILGRLGRAGAGAGPGKVKVMSRFRQQHALALVPRARDPAYVCTWVSLMSPATSRLLMAGRFFRRW